MKNLPLSFGTPPSRAETISTVRHQKILALSVLSLTAITFSGTSSKRFMIGYSVFKTACIGTALTSILLAFGGIITFGTPLFNKE